MSVTYPQLQSKEVAQETNLVHHVRKTPLLLSGIFLELMRTYYSDSGNLPQGINYTWSPVSSVVVDSFRTSGNHEVLKKAVETLPEKTVVIEPEFDEEFTILEKRPGIWVHIGDIDYTNTSKSMQGRSAQIGMDLKEAEYLNSREGSTIVYFTHIGRTKGEALSFATATLDYLDAFSAIITNDFCFERFAPIKITKPSSVKEARRRYVCSVICTLSFQDTWTIKRESPKLRAVEMRIRAVAGKSEDEILATSCGFCN